MLAQSGHLHAASIAPDSDVAVFIEQFAAEHNFDRRKLERWFGQARVQHGILKAIANPTTAQPWHVFRASHVNPARINGGLAYWQRYAAVLAKVAAETGVPEELLVATVGVESFYGRVIGTSKVFDALYTLAFN